MDNRTTQASLKCVIASRAFAVEQNVHRWDTAEDCCVWNICPHWQGKSMKKKIIFTESINKSIFPYIDIVVPLRRFRDEKKKLNPWIFL